METRTVVSYKSPVGGAVEIVKQTFAAQREKPVRRISFVAGLHGDELEGVFLCHRLIQYFLSLQETDPEAFQGDIHIYPAVNPQALRTSSRLWPFFSVDMNRMMGSGGESSLPAETSRELLEDIKSCSDLAVDFHSSNLHLLELPQVRIIEGFDKKLIPLANQCNTDLIWIHPHSPVFETTLGYNLNRKKIPTLVIETGICFRIHPDYCNQIFLGMLQLLRHTGILTRVEQPSQIKLPLVLNSSHVALIQAEHSGLFVSRVKLGTRIKKGETLGELVDPIQGEVVQEVKFPADGLLFTLREHPLTYEGAPLARIALDEKETS